jgi:hypothetical protein
MHVSEIDTLNWFAEENNMNNGIMYGGNRSSPTYETSSTYSWKQNNQIDNITSTLEKHKSVSTDTEFFNSETGLITSDNNYDIINSPIANKRTKRYKMYDVKNLLEDAKNGNLSDVNTELTNNISNNVSIDVHENTMYGGNINENNITNNEIVLSEFNKIKNFLESETFNNKIKEYVINTDNANQDTINGVKINQSDSTIKSEHNAREKIFFNLLNKSNGGGNKTENSSELNNIDSVLQIMPFSATESVYISQHLPHNIGRFN